MYHLSVLFLSSFCAAHCPYVQFSSSLLEHNKLINQHITYEDVGAEKKKYIHTV